MKELPWISVRVCGLIIIRDVITSKISTVSPEVVLGHSRYFLPPPNKHFLREMDNIVVAHWFYRGVQDALTLWKPKYFVSETTVTTTMADFLTIFGMFAIVSTS